jgi:hypothetical protein
MTGWSVKGTSRMLGLKKAAKVAGNRLKRGKISRVVQPPFNHPWKGACQMVPTKRQLFFFSLHLLILLLTKK